MKQFLPQLITVLTIFFGHIVSDHIAAAEPPNLIWIMADDLGYGDLGCYGQKVIQTPHLGRMAREGMRFTHFYAGATVCAPSRSVLMTGLHHGHTRVRGNAGQANLAAQALLPGDVTVSGVLQKAGYKTALIGKWGLGNVGAAESGLPRKHGFDFFFGYLSQHHAHNHFPDFLWRKEERVKLPNIVTPVGDEGGGYGNQGGAPAAAIRRGDWKLIEWQEDGRVELYNLAQDLGEQTDLTGKEPQRVTQLRDELHSWQKQVGAQFPIANSNYDPAKPSGRESKRPTAQAGKK